MALGASVTTQLRIGLEIILSIRQDEGDVIVINEGHEGVVTGDGEHGFTHKLNKTCLVSDVVDGCVDGDDDLAHFGSVLIKCALNLEVANAAFLRVRTEDIIVLVYKTIELVLQVLDAGALISNLELQVSREYGDDFVTLGSLALGVPCTSCVARVLGSRFDEESVANLAHSVTHRSFAPGDLVFAGTIMDDFRYTATSGDCVEGCLEVGASLHIFITR